MTHRKLYLLVGSLVFVSMVVLWLGAKRPAAAAGWETKVDPWVLETAASGETEYLIFLNEQADLHEAATLMTKEEKGTYVYQTLTAVAARSQAPLIAELKQRGVAYQSFWVANMIWVRSDLATAQALAQRTDVAHIYANPTVKLDSPVSMDFLNVAPQGIEWNILQINAPDAWAAGFFGQGIVIGGQDTGYDWDHPAVKNQYRGWNGTTVDHNYSWHDAIHTGNGGVCGLNSPEPCDDTNHGTHTMGTMVGDDGNGNQIGVAPGAKWIGCRNMDRGNGTPATYSECYQWFIAPTDLNNNNPNPAMAPDVINNSWSCPVGEGCTNPNVLLTVVENVRAAGIVTVHSAGNNGPGCSTVSEPAAIYDASFSVGATSSSDTIASFSSRGPVTVDGSNRRKPDVSAPGVGVRSSIPGTGYASFSGTSMAGPHVAGTVALVLSAKPGLIGDVDSIETLIQDTALPRTTTQGCGGDGATDVPNNVYGWGRIDAGAATVGADMVSYKIQMAYEYTGPNELGARVRIADPNQLIILPNATVQATFDMPDGSVTATAVTGSDGWANFIIPTTGGGSCMITVNDVLLTNYLWTGGPVTTKTVSCP